MGGKGKKILLTVLIVVFVAVLAWYVVLTVKSRGSEQEYDEAKQLTEGETVEAPVEAPAEETPAEPTAPIVTPRPTPKPTDITYTDPVIDELLKLDLVPLRAENPEVIGWIHIPDTIISYPIMQTADNDYYLKHSWKNTKSFAGSIFMEHQNSADFSDFNTIIYGHNMRSESMFGSLDKYRNAEYWQAHPYVYIVNDDGVFRYDIFAAHKVRLNTTVYGMKIDSPELREEFISFAMDYSELETGIEPTIRDSLLTLSTCSGGSKNRWVVQAVKNPTECFKREN